MVHFLVLSNGSLCYLDFEDWLVYSINSWRPTEYGYAHRQTASPPKKSIYLHIEIAKVMGLSLEHEIDHKDRNKLNCRRGNLRVATRAQNCQNTSIRRDNTSGYRGVSFNTERQMWEASIYVNKKPVHLGKFYVIEQAAWAYNLAAIKAYGEFAVLNVIPASK